MSEVTAADGVRIHVQDLGRGPVVALVAGFGLDHELWDRQVRVFTANGYRVVCIDQRGHGHSDKPSGSYDVDTLAEDLVTALTSLDLQDVTLVGHSFGGQVAFRASCARPELIGRLVLVGSNAVRASRAEGFPFGAPPETILAALLAEEHADRIAARHRTIASAFATAPDVRVVEWLVRCSLRMPSWAATACYQSMLTTDLREHLPQLTRPVLQVIGARDPVHSAKGARWLTQRLPNATLVEIPDCGHYPMLEAPDPFEAAVMTFASGA